MKLRIDANLKKRFWKKVDRLGPDECWVWSASTNKSGYGRIGVYDGSIMRPKIASRISWLIHNGPIPDGLFALHKCDNPPCVNPAHLFLGTNQDNMDDMRLKDRQPAKVGSKNGESRLSEDDVIKIRLMLMDGMTLRSVANSFSVSISTIHRIKHRESWSHVT